MDGFLCFGSVEAHVMNPGLSDHCPLMYCCAFASPERGRPFRFFNALAQHGEFTSVVQAAWNTSSAGNPMYQVWTKLKSVKVAFQGLYVHKFWQAEEKVQEARAQLDQVQSDLQTHIQDPELQIKERCYSQKLKYWLKVGESIYKQKERVDWLRQGDSNSSFFFSAMKHRYSRNRITTMYDEQGNFLTEPHQVEAEIHRFYKGLLGTSAKELDGVDLTTMKLGPQLSGEARALLCAPITVPDIEAALKDIDDSKAPVGLILCSSNLPGL